MWEPGAGTRAERAAAEAAREAFTRGRHEKKHSADELMRQQRVGGAAAPRRPRLVGAGRRAEAARAIEHGAAYFAQLQVRAGGRVGLGELQQQPCKVLAGH